MRWTCWLLVCSLPWTAAPSQGQAVDGVEVQQQLREVMEDPLFSRWELRRARSENGDGILNADALLDRYGDRIEGVLESFFDWLFERDESANPTVTPSSGEPWFPSIGELFELLGWCLLVLAVVLIAWFVLARFRTGGPRGRVEAVDRRTLDKALAGGNALAADSDAWVRHAQELAGEKDHRLAFRAMYLALLSGLHTAGKIRYRAQRTNWSYVNGFVGDEREHSSFVGLTQTFDDVWYGQQVPGDASFQAVQEQVGGLLRACVAEAGLQTTGGER